MVLRLSAPRLPPWVADVRFLKSAHVIPRLLVSTGFRVQKLITSGVLEHLLANFSRATRLDGSLKSRCKNRVANEFTRQFELPSKLDGVGVRRQGTRCSRAVWNNSAILPEVSPTHLEVTWRPLLHCSVPEEPEKRAVSPDVFLIVRQRPNSPRTFDPS